LFKTNILKYTLILSINSTFINADLSQLSNITSSINNWSKQNQRIQKYKDFRTKEINSVQKAKAWLDTLNIDLQAIANKGYGDKKRLSELLGAYWVLHRYSTNIEQEKIQKHIEPFYQYTQTKQYLNLLTQNDKLFKKNSMSYFRIMWLFKEMNFDISHLLKEFKNIQPRMDAHLAQRGDWQKSMFARYYDIFELTKPSSIAHTERLTGIIGKERPLTKYKRMHSYMLTHQIFVAFDYGNKTTQTRFNEKELKYLRRKLPLIVKHYHAKENWDLVAELLTCMIYLNQAHNKAFKSAYNALLDAQNENGTWGDYEKLRPKYGEFTDSKYYLHTTEVALIAIQEKIKGRWAH